MRNFKSVAFIASAAALLAACSSPTKLTETTVQEKSTEPAPVQADTREIKPVVANHSGYLTKNTGRKVLIQGNTDERGGTEYNLALGQKRAEAVRRAMGSLGVAEGQMEAVSLGEEKPKATGSNEAAWAENRRADIVYQ